MGSTDRPKSRRGTWRTPRCSLRVDANERLQMQMLVKILIRQAKKAQPGNPVAWLEALQSAKWADMSAQNGQIVATSVNGKSVSLQALPGTSIADILTATEVAIETLEAGLDAPPTSSYAAFR